MKDKVTPLMKQYSQIKAKHPDALLLFRLGDFFETFNEDAEITAKVCGITLTKRNNGAAGNMPLAGFPHHQIDVYLPKLVKAGYRVAVCEQLEDPKLAKGIVKRGVVEVVTPGAALYDKLLDSKKNNFLAAISLSQDKNKFNLAGISFCDISTGEFKICEIPQSKLFDVLNTINPSEIIISKPQYNSLCDIIDALDNHPAITKLEPWLFDYDFGADSLNSHFKTLSLKGFGIHELSLGITSAGALIHYINETQQSKLSHITGVSIFDPSEFMLLDKATRRNLEITFSLHEGSKEGTLIKILDKTSTAMGGRILKKWITMPLKDISQINFRLSIVDSFKNNSTIRLDIINLLKHIGDLERLISKICIGRANPRDAIALMNGLKSIPPIRDLSLSINNHNLHNLIHNLPDLNPIVDIIQAALLEEPSQNLGSGRVFRQGYSELLDEYTSAKFSGQDWLKKYQESEKIRTGISTLKVAFNNVFGYFIEISKGQAQNAPINYERKQTLTNSERYTTAELKEFENKILSSEEKILEIEISLFSELRTNIALHTSEIQTAASVIASLDCLIGFAQCADDFNYSKPIINTTNQIDIIEGRHPVVERLIKLGQSFIANNTYLDGEKEQLHIITGPNMAGKSVYLRQIALIILMGQIGSFVPAKSAEFGLVDKIFTRVGAQDNITSGESTFLIEMQEAANIMNNATSNSLILLDEVGRGTATFDGISIAWAIAEYIHDFLGSKTLFATHYHELNSLADRFPKIVNYKVEVIEAGDSIIFSHRVLKGATDHSFGIHVAQIAGMPKWLVDRAYVIMKSLSGVDHYSEQNAPIPGSIDVNNIRSRAKLDIPEQLSIFEFRDDPLREQIIKCDTNSITPIDALKFLIELQKEANKNK